MTGNSTSYCNQYKNNCLNQIETSKSFDIKTKQSKIIFQRKKVLQFKWNWLKYDDTYEFYQIKRTYGIIVTFI